MRTQLASQSDSMDGASELNSWLFMLFVARSAPDAGQGSDLSQFPKKGA